MPTTFERYVHPAGGRYVEAGGRYVENVTLC